MNSRQKTTARPPGDTLMPVSEGLEKILAAASPADGSETVPLSTAAGRILAEDVISPIDVPAYNNSAMDGYAVAGSDLPPAGEQARLQVIGNVLAGHPWQGDIAPGECLQIMTGAVVPDGLDTIILREICQRDGDYVSFPAGTRPGENRRLAGEDLCRGSAAVNRGCRLGAAELGLIASLGQAEVRVRPRLRVTCFSTGDEIRNPGESLQPGQIYDSNRYTLTCLLQDLGIDVIDLGIIGDRRETIETAFRQADAAADVVISSGGVSLGDADYVKETLEKLGSIDFWRLAIKPGRPLAFGRLQNSLFFGLPGNPVAAMVTFLQLVRPALQKLAGQTPEPSPMFRAVSALALKKRPGRTEYLRGCYQYDRDGILTVTTTGHQGSGILTSMSQANCLIVLEEDRGSIAVGDQVSIQPFRGLL